MQDAVVSYLSRVRQVHSFVERVGRQSQNHKNEKAMSVARFNPHAKL